jgi:ABC-type Fe3+ transport system permease subunit
VAGAAVLGAAVILAVRADRGRAARRRQDVTDRAARVGGAHPATAAAVGLLTSLFRGS